MSRRSPEDVTRAILEAVETVPQPMYMLSELMDLTLDKHAEKMRETIIETIKTIAAVNGVYLDDDWS